MAKIAATKILITFDLLRLNSSIIRVWFKYIKCKRDVEPQSSILAFETDKSVVLDKI